MVDKSNDSETALLAERVGNLQAKLSEVTQENFSLKRRLWWENTLVPPAFLLIIMFFLTLIGYPLYKTITSDGLPSYCYVNISNQTGFPALYANIPWRQDRFIGYFCTMVELEEAANRIGCDIKK